MAEIYPKEASVEYEGLIAGPNHGYMRTESVTVKAGEVLRRGALVTIAGGVVEKVWKHTDDDGTTFSEVYGVMAEDVTAEAGTTAVGICYMNGDFFKSRIVVDEGLNVDDFAESARKVDIFFREEV